MPLSATGSNLLSGTSSFYREALSFTLLPLLLSLALTISYGLYDMNRVLAIQRESEASLVRSSALSLDRNKLFDRGRKLS
jgi:hypothetical protein